MEALKPEKVTIRPLENRPGKSDSLAEQQGPPGAGGLE